MLFRNGPSTKRTQLQQNYGVLLHISKALLLPILLALGLGAMKHLLHIMPFSHVASFS